MRKIKFILVVMMSLSVSLEAFAVSTENTELPVRENIEMSSVELDVYVDPAEADDEGAFSEDMGIDITSQDLDEALKDAYAIR